MIFLEHNTTGDGLVTALQLAATLKQENKPLSELVKVMERYPQVLENVVVADRAGLAVSASVADAIHEAETELGDSGRILVRASGTEPLVRVMVEAADASAGPRRGGSRRRHRADRAWLMPDETGERAMSETRVEFTNGSLGAPELAAAFSAFPADVTFVDADGIVRYFSEYRIFSRPESCLGRARA